MILLYKYDVNMKLFITKEKKGWSTYANKTFLGINNMLDLHEVISSI